MILGNERNECHLAVTPINHSMSIYSTTTPLHVLIVLVILIIILIIWTDIASTMKYMEYDTSTESFLGTKHSGLIPQYKLCPYKKSYIGNISLDISLLGKEMKQYEINDGKCLDLLQR